jgi:hypothetical protein
VFARELLVSAVRLAPSEAQAEDAASFRELLNRYRGVMADRLKRIYEAVDPSDTQDAFLIIEFSDRPEDYVQCVFDTPTKMLCEASSGFFLSAPDEPRLKRLPAPAVAALGRLGLSTDDSAGNFCIAFDVEKPPDFDSIAEFMLKALHDGYGARATTILRFDAPLAPEPDESIVQLAARLDQWFDRNVATFASQDRDAQGRALHSGFEIVGALDRVKDEGLTAIAALLNRHDSVTEDQRDASLLRGFALGARLAHTLHDELSDTDSESKVIHLMDEIVKALDAIGPGRAALAALLDHSDAGVRASAGAYLIDLMPERVVPMLREIDEKEHANSAHFTAAWAVLAWEREGKSRFNYLRE